MDKTVYLTCIHDRHTDDEFKAFENLEDAEEYILDIAQSRNWRDVEATNNYGDWCLYITDDYYMMVEEIKLVGNSNE